MRSLALLEAVLPRKAPGRVLPHPSQLSVAAGSPWPVVASLLSLPLSSCGLLSASLGVLFYVFQGHPSWARAHSHSLRSHLHPYQLSICKDPLSEQDAVLRFFADMPFWGTSLNPPLGLQGRAGLSENRSSQSHVEKVM